MAGYNAGTLCRTSFYSLQGEQVSDIVPSILFVCVAKPNKVAVAPHSWAIGELVSRRGKMGERDLGYPRVFSTLLHCLFAPC